MRILFVLLHPGYVRNFKAPIKLLAKKNHHVVLAFHRKGKESSQKVLEQLLQCENLQNIHIVDDLVPMRGDKWQPLLCFTRSVVNYLRYYHPKYANTNKLTARAISNVPITIHRLCQRLHKFGFVFLCRAMLHFVEKIVPVSKNICHFISNINPDLLMITPLIDFGTQQIDIVKSAHFLGIPNILAVHSWDNLTNKGLMQVIPDSIIVWNDLQKQEAIEFHEVAARKIAVTGAQCYDRWFGRSPSVTRKEFCSRIGLPSKSPFILYLCSSPFIASEEVAIVKQWVDQLRNHDNPITSTTGILIRPHPQNLQQWWGIDFSDYDNVVIYPRTYSNPEFGEPEAIYYDSMYYCDAVVGINTSAMIEAGILEKPVLTIITSESRQTQEGTLHFHHLVNGGLVRVANDFTTHVKQLQEVLSRDGSYYQNLRNFIQNFVRPRGLDKPSTPIFVDIVERIAQSPKRNKRWLSLLKFPATIMLYPWTLFLPLPKKKHGTPKKRQQAKVKSKRGVSEIQQQISDYINQILDHPKCLHINRRLLMQVLSNAKTMNSNRQYIGDICKFAKIDHPSVNVLLRITSEQEYQSTMICNKSPWIVKWIEKILQPGDVFFDIGAYIGVCSLMLATTGNRKVKIYAFEPMYRHYYGLCFNIDLNMCHKIVFPLPIAITGKSRLSLPNNSRESPVHKQPLISYSLDQLLADFAMPVPQHIKIVSDELLPILEGADNTLTHSHLRSLLLESHGNEDTSIETFLADKNFSCADSKTLDDSNVSYYLFCRDANQ